MQPSEQPPKAWADLIEGLTVLAKGHIEGSSPLWCEHDTLHVCADEEKFSAEEIARLESWLRRTRSDRDRKHQRARHLPLGMRRHVPLELGTPRGACGHVQDLPELGRMFGKDHT